MTVRWLMIGLTAGLLLVTVTALVQTLAATRGLPLAQATQRHILTWQAPLPVGAAAFLMALFYGAARPALALMWLAGLWQIAGPLLRDRIAPTALHDTFIMAGTQTSVPLTAALWTLACAAFALLLRRRA